jgi:hypothetical protein
MNQQIAVAEAVALLLVEYNDFADETPYAKITKLYKRYVREESWTNPRKEKIQVQLEFSRFCKKNLNWARQLAPLANLHPDLLEQISPQRKGCYFSIQMAKILAQHPQEEQKGMLEEAQVLSRGKQSEVWGILYRMGRRRKDERRGYAYPAQSPPPSRPVQVPLAEPVPVVLQKPILRRSEEQAEADEDKAFLKAFASVVQSQGKRSSIAVGQSKQEKQSHELGKPGEITRGKYY